MIETDRVTVTTLVAVDPATAFAVFTEDVDSWWRKGPRFRFRTDGDGAMRFEPGVGGRLIEVFGEGDAYEVGRVLVWKPAERLAFEFRARAFRPDEVTEVEVRFERESGGTRVTIEHRGWDSLPEDHPVRHGLVGGAFKDMMGTWLGDLVLAFRQYAEGDAEPKP